MAKKYPRVLFIGYIDSATPLPYQGANQDRRMAELGNPGGYEQKRAEYHYKIGRERKSELDAKLAQRWQEMGETQELPDNVKLTVTNSKVYG
jgi:hypothetical protein